MKTQKIIFSIVLFFAVSLAQTGNAQLKVQSSNGNVGVGTLSPIAKFQMAGDAAVFSATASSGSPTSAAFIRGNSNYSGATTPEYTWFGDDNTGIFHPGNDQIAFSINGTQNMFITTNAEVFTAVGNPTSSAMIYNNSGYSGPTHPEYTWFNDDNTGMFHPASDQIAFGVNGSQVLFLSGNAGVFSAIGSPTSSALIKSNSNFSGATSPEYTWFGDDQTGMFHPATNDIAFSVAGTKYIDITNGTYKLTVAGSAFASGIWQGSDKRFKKNINKIEDPMSKVLKLNGVGYEYNTSEYKSYNFDSTKTMGFIAQELNEVVPEVVKKGPDGFYAVNYSAIIPLLVEAFKEEHKKIETLEKKIELLNSNISNGSKGNNLQTSLLGVNSGINNSESKAVLYQNAPNPFNIETIIKFYLPQTVKSANLYIYDSEGNKKKSIPLDIKGEGSVKIAANELGHGVYFYSLILDGVIYDSKTMLITQ